MILKLLDDDVGFRLIRLTIFFKFRELLDRREFRMYTQKLLIYEHEHIFIDFFIITLRVYIIEFIVV